MSDAPVLASAPAPRRVAALLVALGPEAASRIVPRLPDPTLDLVANELMRMPLLTAEQREAILQDAYRGILATVGTAAGGERFASDVFVGAFGETRARELMDRVHEGRGAPPFHFLRRLEPAQAAAILAEEHPQTIALVLACLEPRGAARLLAQLDAELRVDVAGRIARMERIAPEAVVIVEDGLRDRVGGMASTSTRATGGPKPLADLLNQVDRTTEREILDALRETDGALADDVARLMFIFEDLARVDDRGMQRLIRDLDTKDIALALRAAAKDLQERFFANMSSRAAEMLKEDMAVEANVRQAAIEEARTRIIEVAKRLEEAEEITIDRGGGDEDALD
jgi:flagellar motor switch protein FliG